MPALPDGEQAPADGALPAGVAAGAQRRAFGVYVHVPFCVRRCGYCDFNTYTPGELAGRRGSTVDAYLAAAHTEIGLAAKVLGHAGLPARQVATVFVGGGTPTMLPVDDLVGLLGEIELRWGLAAGAEVTTEANPDSVTPSSLAGLAAGGFTRVSFGMQSAVGSVLATLDRTHDPQRVSRVVRWAREAGLAVSLDLIYGTPGERLADWRTSLETVIALRPDHVSAYALTVEPGTAMAAKVRRGVLTGPDPDDQAAKYELADELLSAAGYQWYEVSNWALPDASGGPAACRHNLGYWRSDDWWGIGPGAHSHVGGVRWWNVKHPGRYADRLASGLSPAAGRELLDDEARLLEHVMLGVRLREGLDWDPADAATARAVHRLAGDGLLLNERPAVLSRRGRLLADLVVRELCG